jgi:hypothetical protein
VGQSTTPKFSVRWQPCPELLLRGSIGRGFRAPSLQDLYLPNTHERDALGPVRPGALPGDPFGDRLQHAVQRAVRLATPTSTPSARAA